MRHLTKRALASLAGLDVYACPEREIACGAPQLIGTQIGTQVLTQIDVSIGLRPWNQPTCPKCAVLLDQALAGGVSP
jgi:hypothetical protein